MCYLLQGLLVVACFLLSLAASLCVGYKHVHGHDVRFVHFLMYVLVMLLQDVV